MPALELFMPENQGTSNETQTFWRLFQGQQLTSVNSASPAKWIETDEEWKLVEALKNRDETAFRVVVDRYHLNLQRIARAFFPTQAQAEEVVQETWLAVLEGIDRFEGRSSLKTWFISILNNLAKTKAWRDRRYVPFSNARIQWKGGDEISQEPKWVQTQGAPKVDSLLFPKVREEITPERLVLSKEIRAQIDVAIQKLPAQQRQVITLRDIEELDSKEIRIMLNITANHQRVLLHRARTKVREILDQL